MKKVILAILIINIIVTIILLGYLYSNDRTLFAKVQDAENVIVEKELETENIEQQKENEKEQVETVEQREEENTSQTIAKKYTLSDGNTYEVIAVLNIPTLKIQYPVLSSTSDQLLKISLNKYWGPNPNCVGNFCILGHNYNDNRFFGKLDKIKNNDIIQLTDTSGKILEYSVYDTFFVYPNDTSCTSQLTDGKKEITLITCSTTGQKRFVVKAIEKK